MNVGEWFFTIIFTILLLLFAFMIVLGLIDYFELDHYNVYIDGVEFKSEYKPKRKNGVVGIYENGEYTYYSYEVYRCEPVYSCERWWRK